MLDLLDYRELLFRLQLGLISYAVGFGCMRLLFDLLSRDALLGTTITKRVAFVTDRLAIYR